MSLNEILENYEFWKESGVSQAIISDGKTKIEKCFAKINFELQRH